MKSDKNVDIDHLISLVHQRPVLWDKTEEKYKDKLKTREAWKQVFMEVDDEFEGLSDKAKIEFGKLVMKKWTQVRDSYRKSIVKNKAAVKSEAGASKLKAYIYASQLRFLDKILEGRSTDDTLLENPTDESEQVSEGDKNENDPTERSIKRGKELQSSSGSNNPSAMFKESESTSTSQTSSRIFKKPAKTKRKPDVVELEMISALREKPNRHISFFSGIIPSLEEFDECETIEFQMEVLKAIHNIRKRKHPTPRRTAPQYTVSTNQSPLYSHMYPTPTTAARYTASGHFIDHRLSASQYNEREAKFVSQPSPSPGSSPSTSDTGSSFEGSCDSSQH